MAADHGTYPLPDALETERLRLRPLTAADLDFYIDLHGNRDVVRYLGGDGSPRPPERTRTWLDGVLTWYAEGRPGPYAIETHAGELVGRCGLSIFEVELEPSTEDGAFRATWGVGSAPLDTEVRHVLELGYVVHPRAWGHGYAPEAARRWMDYVLEERESPRISSVIHPDNRASERVAEKNGMAPTHQLLRMEGRDYRVWTRERAGGQG